MRRPKHLRQKAYDYEQGFRQPIHPVWLDGRVPAYFWHEPENRRKYMIWLGRRLRFKRFEDWYHLRVRHFHENRGGGVFRHWNNSPTAAVLECLPEYEWLEWRFDHTRRYFWGRRPNHLRYLEWLGKQLGFQHPEDWYQLTVEDLVEHDGSTLKIYCNGSLHRIVETAFPDFEWLPWKFHRAPPDLWQSRKVRRQYLDWLGVQLGFKKPTDWYELQTVHFHEHDGRTLLDSIYGGSPMAAVRERFPNREWHEWLFSYPPDGFWKRKANRVRYVRWLGKQLRIRKDEDWFGMSHRDIAARRGMGAIHAMGTYRALLREALPDLDWDGHAQTHMLTVEQVLAWADEHHRRTGRWPVNASGKIHGTDETWMSINRCLRLGLRGLPKGQPLHELLTKHRNVRPKRLACSEEDILKWADAFHRKHGTWPKVLSGEIAGQRGLTWAAVDGALRVGGGGLKGGSSLYGVLSKHRGVRNPAKAPKLSLRQVRAWARRHKQETGDWPTPKSGSVLGQSGETWCGIDQALKKGGRGFKALSTLARVLQTLKREGRNE